MADPVVADPPVELANEAAQDWHAALPDDLKAEKSLADYKGKDWAEVGPVLAKSLVETKRLVGTKGITPPKDDAPAEEWGAFYAKLGRPEKPEAYTIARPTDLPEGMTWSDTAEQGFRALAHSIGLTQKQAGPLLDFYQKIRLQELDGYTVATTEARKAASAELEKAWGPKTGPTWQRKYALAGQAVNAIKATNPKAAETFMSRLGDDPDVMNAMAELGERLLEAGEISVGQLVAGETVEDIDAKIAKMRDDTAHPLHQGNMAALDEYAALWERRERAMNARK